MVHVVSEWRVYIVGFLMSLILAHYFILLFCMENWNVDTPRLCAFHVFWLKYYNQPCCGQFLLNSSQFQLQRYSYNLLSFSKSLSLMNEVNYIYQFSYLFLFINLFMF